MSKIKITEDMYINLREEYSGICLSCLSVTFDGVEPDACNYECFSCGKHQVYGIEELLLIDKIELIDDKNNINIKY